MDSHFKKIMQLLHTPLIGMLLHTSFHYNNFNISFIQFQQIELILFSLRTKKTKLIALVQMVDKNSHF